MLKALAEYTHRKFMVISEKQAGVLKGMLIGFSISICMVLLSSYLNPFGFSDSIDSTGKLNIAITSCLIPAAFLGISIARLAKHRFLTPEDIDGGGLTAGTEYAQILQSLLQNTFEQTLLATLVYFAWAMVMPATWLSVIPVAALFFGLGRILFFSGYKNGAPSRALGFTLTFYPTMIMLIVIFGTLIWHQVS